MNERYVNIKQAAEIIGCSRVHVYKLIARDKLKRVDRSAVYDRGSGPACLLREQVEALRPRP